MSAQLRPRRNLRDALDLLGKIAEAQGNSWRAMAYQRAAVLGETVVGDDIAQKIEEWRATGHIRELDELIAQDSTRALLEFNDILGIGAASARKLVAQGYRTRADLILAMQRGEWNANHVQMLGLRYFDDLHKPIRRDIVTTVSESVSQIIMSVAREILRADSTDTVVTVCGSYRRGLPYSNDIDILVASDINPRKFIYAIRDMLSANCAQYVDTVLIGAQKITFLWKYTWVLSVDIIIVQHEHYYASLLYFTGSREFNIWLRERCAAYDYSLNQYGLDDKLRDDTRIILRSEAHIFRILDIPWIPPSARIGSPT